ncbi:hypothetical protein HCH_06626 [Hahella chejuensis KCTC 2396]|uniref:Uncharacterized protein n=1 Tax=Hahella chejuensis (strain KCTC 2396) TaxID=349521 RepID=Q2S7W4_HAHCH|nr:hypothetical protein HCH_06626 [Hahella chejuensis KCTC 2396]
MLWTLKELSPVRAYGYRRHSTHHAQAPGLA